MVWVLKKLQNYDNLSETGSEFQPFFEKIGLEKIPETECREIVAIDETVWHFCRNFALQ